MTNAFKIGDKVVVVRKCSMRNYPGNAGNCEMCPPIGYIGLIRSSHLSHCMIDDYTGIAYDQLKLFVEDETKQVVPLPLPG